MQTSGARKSAPPGAGQKQCLKGVAALPVSTHGQTGTSQRPQTGGHTKVPSQLLAAASSRRSCDEVLRGANPKATYEAQRPASRGTHSAGLKRPQGAATFVHGPSSDLPPHHGSTDVDGTCPVPPAAGCNNATARSRPRPVGRPGAAVMQPGAASSLQRQSSGEHSGAPEDANRSKQTTLLSSPKPAPASATPKPKRDIRKEWSELFATVDSDGGGTIDTREFSKAIKDCQRFVDPESKLGLDFANWDMDQNGSLTEEEFMVFCDQMHSVLGDEAFSMFREEMIANAWEARCLQTSLVHTIIHPEHKGFEFSGKSKNIVTKVHGSQNSRVILDNSDASKPLIMIEKGWKAVAIDCKFVKPEDILQALMDAHREGRKCTVTFEVSDECVNRLGSNAVRKNGARMQLEALLGNRTLEELEELSEDAKDELLRQFRVQCLMVDSMAVMQLDVLLGVKSAEELRIGIDVRDALRKGCDDEVLDGLIGNLDDHTAVNALMSRDAGGNVAVHYCEDANSLKTLLTRAPGAQNVKNSAMQTPIHTFFAHGGASTKEVEAVEWLLASGNPALLLEPDESGICPAMMMEGAVRRKTEDSFSSWADFECAFQQESSALLAALEDLEPKGSWKLMLGYHCFGEPEVWKEGKHTKTSQARLRVVWEALYMALHLLFARDTDALNVARALLEATKGPKHIDLDPRQPYREELLFMVTRLEGLSGGELEVMYTDLLMEGDPDVADWLLKHPNKLNDHGGWERMGLEPRCRMRLKAPSWVNNPNLKLVHHDLQAVGMIGALHSSHDSSYELLCLAAPESTSTVSVEEKDVVLSRWYAAWVLGVYTGQHLTLKSSMNNVLSEAAGMMPAPSAFVAREEPKPLRRICNKMVAKLGEVLDEVNNRHQEVTSIQRWQLTLLGRQAASLVTDISACRYVMDTADELQKVCSSLENSELAFVGVRNCFHRSAVTVKEPYRNIVVWLEYPSDMGPLLIEVELHIRSMFDEMRWMQIGNEVHRGYYDWQHMVVRIPAIMATAAERASKMLAAAMANRDLGALKLLVPKARAVGIEESKCIEGDALIDELETHRELERLIADCDILGFKEKLASARAVGTNLDEVQVELWLAWLHQIMLKRKLCEAWASQDGDIFTSAVDVAKEGGVHLEQVKMHAIAHMFKKKVVQNTVAVAVEDKDIDALREVITNASENGFSSVEVAESEGLLARLEQVLSPDSDQVTALMDIEKLLLHLDMKDALTQAAESRDPEMLRMAIHAAQGAKFSESELQSFILLSKELRLKNMNEPSHNKNKDCKGSHDSSAKSMPKTLRQKVVAARGASPEKTAISRVSSPSDQFSATSRQPSPPADARSEDALQIVAEINTDADFERVLASWTVEEVPLIPEEEVRKILRWGVDFHRDEDD